MLGGRAEWRWFSVDREEDTDMGQKVRVKSGRTDSLGKWEVTQVTPLCEEVAGHVKIRLRVIEGAPG